MSSSPEHSELIFDWRVGSFRADLSGLVTAATTATPGAWVDDESN